MNSFEGNFIGSPNYLDQFIGLIGEEAEQDYCCYSQVNFPPPPPPNYDYFDIPYTPAALEDLFNAGDALHSSSTSSDFNLFPIGGEDSSSATTTATTTTIAATTIANPVLKKPKVDRSKTITSERGRRVRMKEKLYALRSLVPNITKMDKASIVGDAVVYVEDLQMQAKKLRAEIASLESSSLGVAAAGKRKETPSSSNSYPARTKNIVHQMEVLQVEQRGYYVRMVCSREGEGVTLSLYKALESLSLFFVSTCNYNFLKLHPSHSLLFTFTLTAIEGDEEVNLPKLKQYLTGALLNHGFEFATSLNLPFHPIM